MELTIIMGKRWTETELRILKEHCIGSTYKQLLALLPNRTKNSIEAKCRELELNKYLINLSHTWSEQEKLILEKNYSTSTTDEMIKLLPNKTKRAISTQARRMNIQKNNVAMNKIQTINSHKSKLFWDKDKSSLLVYYYNKNGIDGLYDIFPNHRKTFINSKLRDLGIVHNNYSKLINKYHNINLKSISDDLILSIYKDILNGEITNFHPIRISKIQIKKCFIYFITKNGIKERNDIINYLFGELLKKARLYGLVKTNFNSYYEFITFCFPNLNLKIWEFNNLDVPNGFWMNKDNCFEAIEYYLGLMIKDKIIKSYIDILDVSYHIIEKYFTRTMFNYHKYNDIILDFLHYKNINTSNYDYVFDRVIFDSKEERDVYSLLKKHFPNIRKCTKDDYMYNEKYDEGYIPDFMSGNIIFEYYGLYKPYYRNDDAFGNLFYEYRQKTIRKNEFYNSLSNFEFIPIYPIDLRTKLQTLNFTNGANN